MFDKKWKYVVLLSVKENTILKQAVSPFFFVKSDFKIKSFSLQTVKVWNLSLCDRPCVFVCF